MQRLREIPKVEKILNSKNFEGANKKILKNIIVRKLDRVRNDIISNNVCNLDHIEDDIYNEYMKITSQSIKHVINATGVVLQTNLGRSIIHKNILNEIIPLLSHYNNLEYNLQTGKRGQRYDHLRDMLRAIFNVEDALIVNNNAAAVFLILNTFAKDMEVIVSRGELVEIGGSFRIPEVMKNAGVKLVEIGTTNKTHISDYTNAISDNTSMIMKAHKSNFHMVGFTQEVNINDISKICSKHNIIDYYDLGSGYMDSIECNEPSLMDICANPPSLISFSGDKLFGSAQSGIILGKKSLIDKLKSNHLLRALRVDKITISILQATLKRYIDGNFDEIPTIKMIQMGENELKDKSEFICKKIDSFFNPNVIKLESLAGGGSLPNITFKSYGISMYIDGIKAYKLEQELRKNYVITRIVNDKVVFDVRTIQDDEINTIIEVLNNIKLLWNI